MPLSYRIVPSRGLVYVRYWGLCVLDETRAVFERYAADPLCRTGQAQLLDLGAVEGFETDYTERMALHARMADVLSRDGARTLVAYYAPTPVTYQPALLMRDTYDGIGGIVARVLETQADALSFLGQPERSFAALLETT